MALSFVADSMLGRLARWLRALGYDTLYDASWEDEALVRIAHQEGRLLLTRDGALAQRAGAQAILIESEVLVEQLAQLKATVNVRAVAPFSRCLCCNAVVRPISPWAVRERVPAYVYATQSAFFICPSCGRIYWPGTHWERMRAHISAWEAEGVLAQSAEDHPVEGTPNPKSD